MTTGFDEPYGLLNNYPSFKVLKRDEQLPIMFKILSTTFFIPLLTLLLLTICHAEPVSTKVPDKLVEQCGACHGMDGNSNSTAIPSIAGINENYFEFTIEEYKNGNRKSDLMKSLAVNLSADQIGKLANYYAKQTFKPKEQKFDKGLAQKGKELHEKYCAKCHDINDRSDPNNYGLLVGQGIPYLRSAVKEYLDGTRKVNPIMLAKLKRVQNEVGEKGFEQLVNFYASVQ
jgi:sulfide dehydrogenase cytochrome subunit